jgi:hypothetical protein
VYISKSLLLKVLLQNLIFVVFRGDAIIQDQHLPSDQTTAPSETKVNQHEERPNMGLPRNQA